MTHQFKIGDNVRVLHIAGSIWQDRRGVIVDLIPHPNSENVEYAVDFQCDRRWFMADHLTRTEPADRIRVDMCPISEQVFHNWRSLGKR